jgi:prevent-host-death family protein
MEQYTSEDARKQWRRILNETERGERVGVTRYGKPLAVVVPADWYDTVSAYISATTFTNEAADFYARERKAGNRYLGEEVNWAGTATEEQQ